MSGKTLPNLVYMPPAPGEEIVISGISGRFPSSRTVEDFKNNLMNKVDLIRSIKERYDIDNPEIPQEGGVIDDLEKFDSVFFGVHNRQAQMMDPMCRTLMEHAFEAVIDAGINPKHLRGSNTGVVVGSSISETEKSWLNDKLQVDGFGITGSSKTMLANRISYAMNLHGPSYSLDTACSASTLALDRAFRMIQSGECDRVIVGGSNMCLHPHMTLQFKRLGVLSPDCRCKTFEEKANGYVRSEAICTMLLERANVAKRIYATVCYTRSNCDGYKEQGITYPSSHLQTKLFKDFYRECNIPPTCLSYLEAHGTGTSVGDPEELTAISNVFIEGRTTPLKIGSVKSNIGHTEPASGLCSITKIIIGMETGLIPPNLHFNKPLKGIKYMDEGRFQVVTEPTPWEGGYAAINSFGFGGANSHALLKSHTKEKVNNGAPNDDLPRLVVVSGRTEEAVSTLLDTVENKPVDVEYIGLLHNVYCENINGYLLRGYTIAGPKTTPNPIREIQEYSSVDRPICFVFSGMGSQWAGMGEALLRFPIFRKAIEKCDAALRPRGIDIFDVITNKDKKTFDNILNSFVGIASIQIGLVDLLTSVGIQPNIVIGHSVGELGCAYADGCFTAEEMILAAYSRGLASIETEMICGSMAAVGLGYEQVKDLCPPDIGVACHNGPDSCTISGPAESMKKFVEKLQADKIFAREVPCSNIAYHSRYIAPMGPKLLAYLKKVIPNPKPRSSKWLSTSVPRSEWSKPAAKLSSAEYHTNNLLSSVLFAETAPLIPENAVTIEIAPHGLLQAILKRSLHSNVTNVALAKRGHNDNVAFFLQAIGKLYNAGLEPEIANLYPPVEFPVSRGTPMISPHIRWQHSDDWLVANFTEQIIAIGERTVQVSLQEENYEYMAHHVIDGRNLIPATGYLVLVWETLAMMQSRLYYEMPVVFENIKFERATNIPKEGSVYLTIMIQKGTGKFEVVEANTEILSGRIRMISNPAEEKLPSKYLKDCDDDESLDTHDIYKELKLRGYQYTGPFRAMKRVSVSGTKGHIAWLNNWAAFMDNMLQIQLLSMDTRGLYVPTSILKLTIDVDVHKHVISNTSEDNIEIPVHVYKNFNAVVSGGIEIRELNASAIFRRKQMATPVLEEYKFVANRDNAEISINDMITLSTHLALEDRAMANPSILEFVTDDDNVTTEQLLSPIFIKVLGDLPTIQPSVTLAAKSDRYENESLPPNVTMIDPQEIPENASVYFATCYDIFTKRKTNALERLLLALAADGFLLTRESVVDKNTSLYARTCGLNVVLEKKCNGKTLLLLKRVDSSSKKTEVVHVSNDKYDWLEKVQSILKDDEKSNIQNVRLIIVAEDDLENGALGLVKCLKKEPGGEIIRSVIVQDENAPKFSLRNPLYAKQLELNNTINVLRPGNVWGTYRHLPLPPPQRNTVYHGYVSQTVRGDVNSIQWVEGPISSHMKSDSVVHVAYGSLNFRDIMLATGKLPVEAIAKTRQEQDCVIGLEYSGVTATGRRVMGLAQSMGLANICVAEPYLQWDVPDHWTLEDAATVPVAYATAYSALYVSGKIQKGEKVLIHAGSGALGQAAINFALHEGCEVFTTVGTPEKRKFIRETFPSIDDDHIGNSRDTSFEQMIMERTNGEGVDIVLNSLAEEKLQATVRCLGLRGRFLEVGKFDISANNQLGLGHFKKELSFHCIMLDNAINGKAEVQKQLQTMMAEVFKMKAVKPLVRTCFKRDEVKTAFRYMAAGKHIGKVLLKIHENNEPLEKPVLANPYFHASPSKNYIIIGGLGGLGLEMADWLVLRGAKNLTLISRGGIRNGYQRMRTELWKSYGVKVLIISGVDASKTDDCEFILKSAEKQAPVDGIFNLAALLRDGLCVNQTVQTFEESLRPKMWITKKLDQLSRKICPQLRHFVVFSSISCGRGNAGQTNYGLGNAVMERICERRVSEGLPGLAIQWGAVGDVGLAAELLETNEHLDIGGTLQQSILSCLEVLDQFLLQDRPIVGSMIVAEKRATSTGATSPIDAVMNIMSMKDLKGVSQTSTLAEIGMDSMMAVEIKQTLERDFNISLTTQDVRNLNVGKLVGMSEKKLGKDEKKHNTRNTKSDKVYGVQLLLRTVNPNMLNNEIYVELPVKTKKTEDEVFLLPGIEGIASIFSMLALKLTCPATCFQLGNNDANVTVENVADSILPHALKRSKGRRRFTVLGYSFGTVIAIELVRRLEAHGLVGRLILVDGAPDYMKAIVREQIPGNTAKEFQNSLLVDVMNNMTRSATPGLLAELNKCDTWEEKLDKLIEFTPPELSNVLTPDIQRSMCSLVYNRVRSIQKYDYTSLPPITTPITLFKPTLRAVHMETNDYGLSQITQGRVDVHELEGNHLTILEDEKIVAAILGNSLD